MTTIGANAFYECSSLTSIISEIDILFPISGKSAEYPTFSIDVFYNSTLYVPKGTIEKYKTTEGWKDFLWIEEGAPTGINGIKNDGNVNSPAYNLSGRRVGEGYKGLVIRNGKKVVVK